MEFTVFYNDEYERPYILAPGEFFVFSQYGQLVIINKNDNSTYAVPKNGEYVIVFANPDELPLGATIRLIY